MCRYAFKTYKHHYVCFNCRKTFKQAVLEDIIIQNGDWDAYKQAYQNYDSYKSRKFRKENQHLIQRFEKKYRNKKYKCPDCGAEMNNIGRDFKAPKKDKMKEWEIIRGLYKLGKTFHTCGCEGPGFIPQNSDEYRSYLEKIKSIYKRKLLERNRAFSETELSEYLTYWKLKLQLVSTEIIKLETDKVI